MLSLKLKQLRNKAGLTQQELADALNISRSTIAGYEAEQKQPSYEMMVRLSHFFNVSTDYLLDAGLFEPKTYELVSIYRLVIIDKLYEHDCLSVEMRKRLRECPVESCVELLSAYITDVKGDLNSIHFCIKEYLGKLGEKLYHTLTKKQLDDLPYIEFDEIPIDQKQSEIIEDIENLPIDEQKKIRDYIVMYHKLNPSVAADEKYIDDQGKSQPSSGTGGGTIVG